MASLCDYALDTQPPSYEEATRGETDAIGGELTFVDFMPLCLKPWGLFTKPKFEPFSTLIDRGNEWLLRNPKWEVRTCESVEFKCNGQTVDTEKITYMEYGKSLTWYLRGLRLWVVPRSRRRQIVQQIGYVNLVPQKVGKEMCFGMPSFESLNDILGRCNAMIQADRLTGKIINVESQEMKLKHNFEFDPDQSDFHEMGSSRKQFLFILRVYFEITSSGAEEIGMMDFIPSKISDGGVFSPPKYEPFSNVVQNASNWCQQQNGCLRICNIQSLEIKLKFGQELNTQKMSYTEHGDRTTYYIRIIRVAYTRPSVGIGRLYLCPDIVHQLTCKTFVPVQLTSSLFMPEFESLGKTKLRIESWIKATGANVISAETSAMRLCSGGEATSGAETTLTYNVSERQEYWIFVVRVYMNGFYQEPPRALLPPYPELQDNCCHIL